MPSPLLCSLQHCRFSPVPPAGRCSRRRAPSLCRGCSIGTNDAHIHLSVNGIVQSYSESCKRHTPPHSHLQINLLKVHAAAAPQGVYNLAQPRGAASAGVTPLFIGNLAAYSLHADNPDTATVYKCLTWEDTQSSHRLTMARMPLPSSSLQVEPAGAMRVWRRQNSLEEQWRL